jgi:hypothetical protein
MAERPRTAHPILWLALVAVAGACGEDPRVARRATAIDVAGAWQEQRGDGLAGAAVVIGNEADKNDVVVSLTGRVVDAAEAGALALVIDPATRDALADTLVLGEGRDAVREETDGGENVSFDLGETTTVQVVGVPVQVTASSPSARDASLGWALRLRGSGQQLDGLLDVFVREEQPRPGDVDGFTLVTTQIASIPLTLLPTAAAVP